MITKRTLDRVGGAGSVLVGIVCLLMGYRDWQFGQSLWKVWAVMFVVLVVNGIAMIRYAKRRDPMRTDGAKTLHDGVARGSTRV